MTSQAIDDEATYWAVRTADPEFDDWETFSAWIDSDPANNERYNLVASAALDASEALAASPASTVLAAAPRRVSGRRWLIGSAAAASLAGAIVLSLLPTRSHEYIVEAAPGRTRTVELDGSTIQLAANTRITLDRDDPRRASLERGEAMFVLRHDASRPFRVSLGADEVVDVGTAFDIKRDADVVRVAVSEGEVIFNPTREKVRLTKGKALLGGSGATRLTVSSIDPRDVGAWRIGQLNYDGASLAEVARDLSREIGVPVTAATGTEARRVRATIKVADVRDDPATLGPLLGITVRRDGRGWQLSQ